MEINQEWIDQQRGRMGKRLTYDNGCGHGILCASKRNDLSAGCVLCCNEICEQHRREHGGNCGGCVIQLAFDALAEHETVLPSALDALEAALTESEQWKRDYGSAIELLAEKHKRIDDLTAALGAAIRGIPKICVYCAKRRGWDTCKDDSFVSDGNVCLSFQYGNAPSGAETVDK